MQLFQWRGNKFTGKWQFFGSKRNGWPGVMIFHVGIKLLFLW